MQSNVSTLTGISKLARRSGLFCPSAVCPDSPGELALRAAQVPQLASRHVPGGRADHRFSPMASRSSRPARFAAAAG